jgi:hypothetical protein
MKVCGEMLNAYKTRLMGQLSRLLRSLKDPACLRPLQECTRMLTETSPGRFKGLVLTAELHDQLTTKICEFDSGR